MEVELIAKEGPDSPSKSKDKRPPQLSIPREGQPMHRWRECKIIGKNISIRSYGASCAFQKRLYLYGGYQILMGGLQDFYSISLDDSEPTFNWIPITPKSKTHPGPRVKHALVSTKSRIYLIGGLLQDNTASNQIFSFDPQTETWELVKPEGDSLPPLESFGAAVTQLDGQQRILMACGFNQLTASPSNAVFQYNPSSNRLKKLHEGSREPTSEVPTARSGCAVAADGAELYIFGGKNEDTRLNDLWSFSLKDFKFQRLPDHGEVPAVRNGHSMTYYQGRLYVFGGIHDITWQLDDLHIYSLKSSKWTTLEQDSPRKLEKKAQDDSHADHKNKDKSSPKKRGWYQTMGNVYPRASSPISASKHNFSSTLNEDRNESPGKMLDEQRRKVFYQKKAEMLKNFEVSKEEVPKYLALETSSQAMKISLDVIGNPDPKTHQNQERLTDFGKESVSKFLGPLNNSNNVIAGKKPCARDGHCAVLMGDQLVICCGDRHQMSFNDIYKLDLAQTTKALPN